VIRIALIGYGYAGRTFHAPLIRATPGLALSLVISGNAARVRGDLGDTPVAPDPAAAFENRDVDAVVIATPNHTHAPLASHALTAGKHVVVDKPFTLRLDEAIAVAQAAERAGRLLSVFHNRRWDSDFKGLQTIVSERALGTITHVESHFDRFRPEVRQRWREEPGPGSGIWFDLGPHLIDQALQLFGIPDRVTANLAASRPGARTDDWSHAILEYGERRVLLHASMLAAARLPRFIVHGTSGSWIKYGLDTQEQQLIAGMLPGSPGWGEDPEPGLLYDGSGNPPRTISVPPGDYREFYGCVRQAIEGRGPNPVPPSDAIAVMAVLETAMRSASSGQKLEVVPFAGS
jgi:predicted dehydrogenase